jgi:tRNA nucleotidyltransferase/poly(A) polymerase
LVECVEPHVELYAEDGVTLLDTHFCSLEEDACRRDYTCNALYKNLHTGEVLDPTGSGRQDLKEGLLRTPGDPELIFRQDPVRMLRGIRFKHQKGFHFLPETWDAIVKHHEEMKDAAPKRVRDELNKIIKTKTLGEAFEDLYTCGLLPYIMPDLVEFIESDRCVPYLKDADCTIWQHTRQMLRDLTNYYPHSDTTTRLAVLTLHLAEMGSKKAATQFLLNSQIGKERTSSVIHLLDMLFRSRTFYQGGAYVARPRALPHFVKGLGRSVDAFRQLLRASNVGARDEYILPYDAFYTTRKGGSAPTPQAAPVRRPNGRENADIDGETSRTTPEKHRRNVRRREQRKRSRSRKRKEQGDAK